MTVRTQYSVRMLLPYLRRYRRVLLLAIIGTAAFNALSLTPPLIFRHLIDSVVEPGKWDRLALVIAIYLAAPLLAQAVQFVVAQVIVSIAHRMVADIRIGLYRLLLRLSMRFHGETSTGSLVTRLMGDVGTLQQLVSGQTIQLVGDLMVFLFSVFIAFSIHHVLAAILVVVAVLYAGAYLVFSRHIRAATHSMRTVNDLLVGRLQETLHGVRHVRIYSREIDERETFLQRATQGLDHALSSGMSSVGLGATCTVIAGYGSTVIYALAGYYVLCDEMTLGDLLALNTYVWMALNPALRLAAFAGQFSEVRVSLQRVLELLVMEPDISSKPGAPDMRCTEGRVEFRDIGFRYKEDEPLFQGLTLSVEPNTTVALVGHTGCGKTTLTALLMRLWDVREGRVLIDGTDVRSVSLSSLRNIFGVVLQDPIVFEGTIAENIAYGRPEASRQEIEDAARTAEVIQFSGQLPNGLDSMLGTYGVKLSVGQKQRVSIARAILRNPPILVMDEATSALDSEAEAAIQRAVARVLKGRTSFVVAHRLSTIVGADLIVVMDHGSIVEKGTHEELMQIPGGLYHRLYKELQRAGREGAS
ncbi:MAG: ABC transporter ATP-binding protein [Lentisphaerales bacterium]|jgi:ABC-type multidrug transport system fused ATPase/permease subunit|nr:MAG: ABC transporter ATP-binding protein [Lentisphaerales bacterium]